MKQHQSTLGKSDTWITPKFIIDALGGADQFDLDPCAADIMPWKTAKKQYIKEDNGFTKEWTGNIWLNPPFHRYERPLWMERMATHNRGIMLVPAACETEAFYKYVWGKSSGVLFLQGRPHFCYTDGTPAKANSGCTICLVAYGLENLGRLRNSKLGIVVIDP